MCLWRMNDNLASKKGIELIDNWPYPPLAMGSNAVYPEIPFEERVDMWDAIYVMNTAIEYEM